MGNLVMAALLASGYLYYRSKDRRLLRNGVLLVAAAWFALVGVLDVLSRSVPQLEWAVLVVLALTPLAVLVLAAFLIANGITMLRLEGRSLGNLLSLLAGAAVALVPLLIVALVLMGSGGAFVAAVVLFFLASYLGVAFVVYLVGSLAYRRTTEQDLRPAVLIVLGSRVVGDRVPPLLRSRLDKALGIYQDVRAVGPAPLLIPTGGQGADEIHSEGGLMGRYLVQHGAAPEDVRPETQARNTRENLVLAQQVQARAGRVGPTLAVTSDYHVLRTALLARRLGSDIQVVGARTARYFVPSAFLREFAAVMVDYRWWHALLSLPFVAVTAVLLVAFVQGSG
ncbi:YdcF family protein [Georgenia sp. TF02-10]|uniref:YdcF family protein n=1 Tax=Georgenia sp. TF02-10 TaxID=2917725 RepID=UPI001FA6BC12|nr:YdcF family protein [Georgenia sp. TF02-10]UNX54658.1 YdcF family protein [Georgenia sp. TF02-10]